VDLDPAWGAWLSGARAFSPEGPHTFTWRVRETRLDLTLLNTRDQVGRVILADAPGWRRGSPASELEKPPVQQVLVESRGAAPARLRPRSMPLS
jgi:hypothetical protein